MQRINKIGLSLAFASSLYSSQINNLIFDNDSGNGGTHFFDNDKLIMEVNGGSDGYMGKGDGYTVKLSQDINLTNKIIKFNLKEILRKQINNYKENISINFKVSDDVNYIGVSLSGEYSGYYPDIDKPGWDYYNQYHGHRLYLKGNSNHQWNRIDTIELNTGIYYDIDFKITNIDNNYSICYKEHNQTIYSCKDSNIKLNTDIPEITFSVGSGDGGYTRKNGYGKFEIDYFNILESENNTTLSQEQLNLDIYYPNGWNLSGVGKDENLSVSNIKCENGSLNSIWKYKNNQWNLFTPSNYDYGYTKFDTLNNRDGFWINCK